MNAGTRFTLNFNEMSLSRVALFIVLFRHKYLQNISIKLESLYFLKSTKFIHNLIKLVNCNLDEIFS